MEEIWSDPGGILLGWTLSTFHLLLPPRSPSRSQRESIILSRIKAYKSPTIPPPLTTVLFFFLFLVLLGVVRVVSKMAMVAEAQFHVLAVDDSLTDRKLIERLLKTSSYQVTTVDSGSKALEFLGLQQNQRSPTSVSPHHNDSGVNLIITDYWMPGMTGFDLLKKIKESSSLKDIPVVIMSSENVPSRINRCLEEGAEEFFLKPVQLSDMKRLRPHILKGKSKDQQQPLQRNINIINSSSSSGINKRKAADEVLSPGRTKPRSTAISQ